MKKTVLALLAGFVTAQTVAHDRFENVEIKSAKLSESVHMLTGAGGNIGVSAGADGVLVIDDQFEELGPKIRDAIKAISDSKIRYLINTHYHGDHTGSNAWFKDNEDVTIFAHDNVRMRLISDEKVSGSALPVVTYEQGVKFHFNGDTIHVKHVPASHTDGDSFVWFEKQNIIHAGDMLFKNWFPYIDLDGGGTVQGYMNTLQAMIDAADENTQIIPGHGSLATRQDLQNSLHMLQVTAKEIKARKEAGMTMEEAVAKGLDSKWDSWSWNFIPTERWIKTLYRGQ